MGQLLMSPSPVRLAVCAALLLGSCAARGAAWELDLDLRAVTSDAAPSVLDGGYSPVRFGEDQSGLQLGRVRLALDLPVGEVWRVHVDASAWGKTYPNPIGVTEAYLEYRPYPRDDLRLRVKVGAFYAPLSLENRAGGWASPYTLSYSAMNSWIAEELRTLGAEAKVDWLGTRLGLPFDVSGVAGVFGWNEGAGAALANGGFILDDRQTSVFGRVGTLEAANGAYVEPFRETDGRAGYYGGTELHFPGRVLVTALHYDNRADPTSSDVASHVFAWNTTFNTVGARVEYGPGWTLIGQWIQGRTEIAPPAAGMLEWPFTADYVLLSRRFGSHHMLSIRFDQFDVDSRGAALDGDGEQNGHAWTAAYVFDSGKSWTATLEYLRVTSTSYEQSDELGLPGPVTDTQLQLAVRYALSSTGY